MLLSADLVLAPPHPRIAEHDYTPDPWAEHVASLERARRSEPRPCSCRGTERPTRIPPRGSRERSSPRLPPKSRVHALIATTPRSTYEVVDEHPRARRAVLPAPGSALRGHLPRSSTSFARGSATAVDGSDGVRRFEALL